MADEKMRNEQYGPDRVAKSIDSVPLQAGDGMKTDEPITGFDPIANPGGSDNSELQASLEKGKQGLGEHPYDEPDQESGYGR